MSKVLDFNSARPLADGEQAKRGFDAEEVRTGVAARAREFVLWIFPHAVIHRSGRYAVIGDVLGAPGDSLHIELTGKKAGYWRDWNSKGDEGKDLIGLFLASMGWDRVRDFPKAIDTIAREFLHATSPEWSRPLTKVLKERSKEHDGKAKPEINDRPPPSDTYIYEDFSGSVIGLIRRYDLDDIDPKTGKPRKTFSVWDPQAGKAQAPTPRPLYHIPQVSRASHVVFVEGEKKANALASAGIDATCIMFGANAPLDKVDWTPITGKTVTVWPDNDASGIAFSRRLAEILTALGCHVGIVTPPPGKPEKWDAADCIADGEDPHAIIASATEFGGRPADISTGFKLYTLDELEDLPPPKWLVEGIITENGLSLLWAGSDSYKTFVVIDLAMCVASAVEWHGRAVEAGLVVYIAAEDDSGVKMRMLGWRATKGVGLAKPNVRIFRDGFTLASGDNDHLINAIADLHEKPKLIIIDTLAKTFGTGNENQTADMNAYVLAADRLRAATNANVMIVHHTGVNTERERGNMALRGACNTIMTIARNGDRIKLINSPPKGKQKNSEPFPDLHFRLQKVHFDYRGEETSTLIVMSDDCTPAGGDPLENDEPKKRNAQPLGQIEKSIMAALVKGARAGHDLGFNALHAMVKGDKGNFGRSLRSLVGKRLVEEVVDPRDDRKLYRIRT